MTFFVFYVGWGWTVSSTAGEEATHPTPGSLDGPPPGLWMEEAKVSLAVGPVQRQGLSTRDSRPGPAWTLSVIRHPQSKQGP
jgi:hypothetical protein